MTGRLDGTVALVTGRLDTRVNNAGVMLLGPAIGAPVEEWERMIALNLQGLLWVTHGPCRTCSPLVRTRRAAWRTW